MAFFKKARDQMKVEAFVSHLERAQARFAPGFYETALSLKWAQEAMEKIKNAKAEYFFSRDGWLYVAKICDELGNALMNAGRDDLYRVCFSMFEWALYNEDKLGGGVISTLRSLHAKRTEANPGTEPLAPRMSAGKSEGK